MLSIEKPQPPDPPCPCEISQLKSGSDDDERAWSDHKLGLREVVDPHLLRSGLDDEITDNHPQLPNFSIRDYVFTARSKDIKTNWPFSQRNLHLCLKHGVKVKDVLPPFQPIDSVRNPSFKRCAVQTSLFDKENISRSSKDEPSGSSVSVLGWNEKLAAADHIHIINSCRSEGEELIPSTTTSHSQSDIDSSVPPSRPPSSTIETDTLLEAPVELEAAGPPASHKIESTTQPSSKKCRLIVKLGTISDPSSIEDITSNCTTLSEAMASKVCPVCKTFSSSSNTTLNAHIDQCLSVESPSQWMENSKLTKHRIKPRKMRLMVDICATAPRCTLEELDRRNGSSWATDSCLPTRDTEVCAEGKKQRASPVYVEDTGDEGAVYIDANGTKLRILSKFNDASSIKIGVDCGPRKSLKGGKGSKFSSTNKKRLHAPIHHKYLKLTPQSENFCSPKARSSEIHGDQEGNYGVEESCEKDRCLTQLFKAQEQIKPNDPGTLRQWVCSKRTGLSKKINGKDGHQRSGYKSHVTQDLLVENDRSYFGDSCVERSHVLISPNSSENPISSPERNKRMDNPLYEAQANETREWFPGRKGVGSPLFGSRISDNMERSLEPMMQNTNQLSKESTFVRDNRKKPRNYMENHASSLSNKTVEIHAGPVKNSDSSPNASTKPSRSCHVFTSKATRLSTLRKNVLSGSRSSVPESKFNSSKKCSGLKKSRVHKVESWPSEVDQPYESTYNHTETQSGTEEITGKVSLGRSSVLEIRQERGGAISISQREEAMALKSSQSDRDVGGNIDSSVRVGDDFADKFDGLESATKEIQIHGEDIVIESSSRIAVGRTVMSLSNTLDPKLYKLTNPSDRHSNSLQSIEVYKGPFCGAEAPLCSNEPSLGDGHEMFCTDEDGDGIMGQNIHVGVELDSKLGQETFFSEVDPIPIPGPPGSFLPSPGDMGSEDLQGNSSLTTSLVQSSQDQHDLVDRDSSDSPISATSTISNSTAARSDLKYSEQLLSVGPHAVQDKIRSGFSGAMIEPLVETAATVSQTVSIGAERINLNGDNFKVNVISPKRGLLSFKDHDQPCCCSRKEGISLGFSLNYQESQLLRRRTMASVAVPSMGKQMDCNPNTRPNCLNVRPEMFSRRNCSSLGSEKVVLPVMKSPAGPIPTKGSADAAVKLPTRGDCDSASPSASNPILRLMGKNLMVGNNDEDASVQLRQAQPGVLSDRPNQQFLTFSGVTPGNIQNQDYHSFHHMVPQGSVVFGQDSRNTVGQCFDVRLSNSFRNHISSKSPHTPTRAPAGMFSNKRTGGGFTASLEPHEYRGEYNSPTQQNRHKSRLDAASTYNLEEVITTPNPQNRNSDSTANLIKEIIIIDDAPESEADSTTDDAKYTEGLGRSHASSAGISILTAPDHNSRHVYPLSHYQSQDLSPLGESPMLHNTSFHAPTSRRANTSPAKWGCTAGGSSVVQRSPFMASSS